MTDSAFLLFFPSGASHVSQREIHHNKTSTRKQTQTVSSFPPTLFLFCSAWGTWLPCQSTDMPNAFHLSLSIYSLWDPHDSGLHSHLTWTHMKLIPHHYQHNYPPILKVHLALPQSVVLHISIANIFHYFVYWCLPLISLELDSVL